MSHQTQLRSDSQVGADRVSAFLPAPAQDQPIELGVLGRSLAFHVRRAQLVLQRQGLRLHVHRRVARRLEDEAVGILAGQAVGDVWWVVEP